MKLQDWYNQNIPDEDLIYGNSMSHQFVWVRDTLAGMIFHSCSKINPDFKDWETSKKYLTVENTHTSKSCVLPVYKFTIGDMVMQIRGNFHDWCVIISNIDTTTNDFPTWMQPYFSYGYYEGMDRDPDTLEFCVYSQELLYAILWWMFNERI